ncbi:hypothetical protein TPHA_0P01690 [Tetrapisispora phaffii CBS 4417]|uniref:Mannosyltransferase n=1 Tax=Tetrapisispora phaffii (strain ATCC 24235 / CBS 4417 / NBRC 1672 / NRRL Y-8282 / UCD 70-5) TaxID=1071381 RepID=G8C2E9_TETPH|nr:hypothetical protein TPHA_0P01690 [Tetrapisispora phaffii CBS 4417]CCE66327.1 hypothetical protein TPHA_0P01690 [Tetrapisispora phaffii CBS 4417]
MRVITVLLVTALAISRLYVQPWFSIISDCDETFNYWEPLNLLLRGFGKQTWEYSPAYAIRSWAFLLPFYGVLYPIKKFELIGQDGTMYFYIIRAFLGLLSFLFEFDLFKEIQSTISLRIADMWLFIQLFNPGWFHASVEFLPSSIAMIFYLGSIKYSLRYLSSNRKSCLVSSLGFNFTAAILGWPFVLVLSVPLCLHFLLTHRLMSTIRVSFDCLVIFLTIASIVIGIDSSFYGKFSPVSWNILSYNVLEADESSGPNIFGIEPWYYYLLNLLLNFPLPVLGGVLFGIFNWRLWPLSSSLLLWLVIFTLQLHKEERFLYPIYGLISLSSAVGLYQLVTIFSGRKKVLKRMFSFIILLGILLQASSRIIALLKNYSAPFETYSKLYEKIDSDKHTNDIINVCTGREWYHFPNSFFLPDNYRLRFVKSGFDGLLPGDFDESNSSIFQKVRKLPENMNNKNIFDPNKIWDAENCDYFIDLMISTDIEQDVLNPNSLSAEWSKVSCSEFIDVDNSKIFGRAFYIPEPILNILSKFITPSINKCYGVNYIDYCLFEKDDNIVMEESANV